MCVPRQAFKTVPHHAHDAVLLVKMHICSTELAQPPLLLLPRAIAAKVQGTSLPPLGRNPLTDREIQEYRKTAKVIGAPPWKLLKAAHYLERLVENNVAGRWLGPPRLTFVFDYDMPLSLRLPPPPDWLNYAPTAPRTVVVYIAATKKPTKPPKKKARVCPKVPPTSSATAPLELPEDVDDECATPRGRPAGSDDANPKAKAKGKAKSKAMPKAEARKVTRELPAGQILGCSKCRFGKSGCARCRARVARAQS